MKQSRYLLRLVAVCSLSMVFSNQVFAQKALGNTEENVDLWVQPYLSVFRQVGQGQTEAVSPKAEQYWGTAILNTQAKAIRFVSMAILNTQAKATQFIQEKVKAVIPYSSIISMLYESSRPKYASEFKARKNNRFLTIRYKKPDASEWVVVLFLGKTQCQDVIAELEARTGKKTEGML